MATPTTAPRMAAKSSPNTDPIRFCLAPCSLGLVLVATSTQGICAIFMDEDPVVLVDSLLAHFPHAERVEDDATLKQQAAQVIALIETPQQPCTLTLDIRGTPFQQRVWQALREVPAGATISYTTLARRIGTPTAVRAAANACATNLLAIAIPCHRALRSDGGLAGYRWGTRRKQTLLEREAQAVQLRS